MKLENYLRTRTIIIHEFQKNNLEKIKISIQEFRGYKLLDIRIYYENDKKEFFPTRKGISLSLDLFSELLKGIEKAKAKIVSDGK